MKSYPILCLLIGLLTGVYPGVSHLYAAQKGTNPQLPTTAHLCEYEIEVTCQDPDEFMSE